MIRWVRRLGAALAGAVAAVAVAGGAFAHVEVGAVPAVGGATNALITFSAEAESDTAGITTVQIILPAGIRPTSVTLASGPAGWTLTPGPDGYTVGGPALAKGADAVHAVRVAALPNTDRLVFKALVTYTDGKVDRWIEEPSSANPNPENPAPILTLTPGPSNAITITRTETTAAPAPAVAATPAGTGTSGSPWVWILVGLVVLAIALGVALIVLRRRRSAA